MKRIADSAICSKSPKRSTIVRTSTQPNPWDDVEDFFDIMNPLIVGGYDCEVIMILKLETFVPCSVMALIGAYCL